MYLQTNTVYVMVLKNLAFCKFPNVITTCMVQDLHKKIIFIDCMISSLLIYNLKNEK
jgi:hypothetical protein